MQRNMNINIDQMNIDTILEKTTYQYHWKMQEPWPNHIERESGCLEKWEWHVGNEAERVRGWVGSMYVAGSLFYIGGHGHRCRFLNRTDSESYYHCRFLNRTDSEGAYM